MIRRLAIGFAILFAASCTSDPETSGGGGTGDTGAGAADVGDDASATCAEDLVPVHGEPCDCEDAVREGREELCDYSCECVFLFWECNVLCDEPEALRLEWEGEVELDESEGNGDALVNPGETWAVTVAVRALNAGDEGADATIRLSADSLFVDVEGASTTLEGLGEDAVSLTLRFRVEENAPARPMAVTVEAFTAFVSLEHEVPFEVVAEQIPVLGFTGSAVQDEFGGPAVRIEAGDTIHVVAMLENNGPVAAEGVSVTASASSGSLAPGGGPMEVGVLASDAPRRIDFAVVVSSDPVDLAPTVTLSATATNATTSTEVIDVSIHPPDNLDIIDWAYASTGGSDWVLQVDVRNSGRFELTGIEWSRINYESPPPPAEPEEPFFASMGFGDPTGPSSLAAGATATVELPLTVGPATPETGRLLLRASSVQRSHGPFPIEVTRP